jgi:putative transposase
MPAIAMTASDHRTTSLPNQAPPPTAAPHRRVAYTTNAIEALNRQLRKAVKTKDHFPTEDAARKLLYLAIQNAVPQWTRTRGWTKALLAFKIQF